MEPSSTAGQMFLDLWLSGVKMLGRPAVQRQVLVAVIVVLAAWLLARWLTGRLRRRYAARADAVRGAYVDGYSYAELAERHDVPVNTMRTWLRRSLIRLRECLER